LILIFCLGRVAISGSVDGVLVISSLTTGMTIRVLNDHRGGQLNTIIQQQVCFTTVILLPCSNRFYYITLLLEWLFLLEELIKLLCATL